MASILTGMARKSSYEALNQRMRGQLPQYLSKRKARSMSNHDIANALLIEYDIDVTAETVRQWCGKSSETNGETP